MLTDNTPIEQLSPLLFVKREDLASPYPGPSFAKIRGVLAHMAKRPETLIGVLDTFHSKAGWAVSYCARHLGKRCLDFFPHYKADTAELRPQQAMAHQLGAELVALPAGRSAILFHAAKKRCLAAGGYMMPNALKLPETVEECRAEVLRSPRDLLASFDRLIISVSSGTIASGVLLGFQDLALRPEVILHLGYDRSEKELLAYIAHYGVDVSRMRVVNERFGYKDASRAAPAPFPCNPHYDLKAWAWMLDARLPAKRTLFWNIGS